MDSNARWRKPKIDPRQQTLFGPAPRPPRIAVQARTTRRRAADAAAPRADSINARVVQYVRSCKSYGTTRDQIEADTGIKISTVCPAIAALKAAGLVVITTRERLTRGGKAAEVIVAAEFSSDREGGVSEA